MKRLILSSLFITASVCASESSTTTTTTTTAATTIATAIANAHSDITATWLFNKLVGEGMDPVPALEIAVSWHAPLCIPQYQTARPRPESKDNAQ